MRKDKLNRIAISSAAVVAVLLLAGGAAYGQTHSTGMTLTKNCPMDPVAPGSVVNCTFIITNSGDDQHGVDLHTITNTFPCNEPIDASTGTCGAGSGLPVNVQCFTGGVAVTGLGPSGNVVTRSCTGTAVEAIANVCGPAYDVFDVVFADATDADTGTFANLSVSNGASGVVHVSELACAGCGFLVIDEDSIDNGLPPEFFDNRSNCGASGCDVNDHIAAIGLRSELPFFAANVGLSINLWTGTVGDEGWFALKTIPPRWNTTTPTADGLTNFLLAGAGLGSGKNKEKFLDKIPDVTPLRADGLAALEGSCICAVVYDSDISINYSPLNGSLKGANLGIAAFTVNSVTQLFGQSSGSLPVVNVTILDAEEACGGTLGLFTDAPEPISSSVPYDIDPDNPGAP